MNRELNIKIGATTFNLIQADITKVKVDAIVNSANTSLLGGGGVDGAIHRAGGESILEECVKIRNKQGGCKVGEAVLTTAGKLPAKYVIHAVGPVWNNNINNEDILLSNAYKNSLAIAAKHNLKSIAFPNISTGIFRFPRKRAAIIALDTVLEFFKIDTSIEMVVFVCHEPQNCKIYLELMRQMY